MLTDMYSLVEAVVASCLVVWGLAFILNKHIVQSFFDTFTNIEKNETLSYLTAGMFLILGLITVWIHNDWHWRSPTVLLITLIGWTLVFKSSLWLLFPKFLADLAKKFSSLVLSAWFRMTYGIGILLVGLWIIVKYLFFS